MDTQALEPVQLVLPIELTQEQMDDLISAAVEHQRDVFEMARAAILDSIYS
jgi:hypothetical protein